MFCYNCGTKIKEGNKFCTNCGCKVKEIKETDTKKTNNNIENYKITKGEKVFIIIVAVFVILFAIYLLIRQGVIKVGGFYL